MTPPLRRRAVLPAILAVATLAAMGATVRYLKSAVRNAFVLESAGVSQESQGRLQELLDRHRRDLGETAATLGGHPPQARREFDDRAARLLAENPAFVAANFFNNDFRLVWGFPYAASRAAEGLNLRTHFTGLAAARRSLENRAPALSGPVDLLQGDRGVLMYAPAHRDGDWIGLIEGVLQIPRFAARFIEPLLGPRFRFLIVDERRGEELHSTLRPGDRDASPAYDAYFTLSVADRVWWVVLHPVSPPPTLAIAVAALTAELAAGAAAIWLSWRKRWR